MSDYIPEHLADEPVDDVPERDEPDVWLTASRRQAIYALAASVGALLVAWGLITDELWQPILAVIEQLIVLLAVALPHTDSASTRERA